MKKLHVIKNEIKNKRNDKQEMIPSPPQKGVLTIINTIS